MDNMLIFTFSKCRKSRLTNSSLIICLLRILTRLLISWWKGSVCVVLSTCQSSFSFFWSLLKTDEELLIFPGLWVYIWAFLSFWLFEWEGGVRGGLLKFIMLPFLLYFLLASHTQFSRLLRHDLTTSSKMWWSLPHLSHLHC